jgi:hypothetical protein
MLSSSFTAKLSEFRQNSKFEDFWGMHMNPTVCCIGVDTL